MDDLDFFHMGQTMLDNFWPSTIDKLSAKTALCVYLCLILNLVWAEMIQFDTKNRRKQDGTV